MKIKDILLVDDDRVAAAFITDIFVNEGFSVRHVCDGKEALDAIRSKAPDVILTDIVMPKISGKDLIRHVREMPDMDNIPIIDLKHYAAFAGVLKCLKPLSSIITEYC